MGLCHLVCPISFGSDSIMWVQSLGLEVHDQKELIMFLNFIVFMKVDSSSGEGGSVEV